MKRKRDTKWNEGWKRVYGIRRQNGKKNEGGMSEG
jgi:hypothetical protein